MIELGTPGGGGGGRAVPPERSRRSIPDMEVITFLLDAPVYAIEPHPTFRSLNVHVHLNKGSWSPLQQ
jgi:hypothetical protein